MKYKAGKRFRFHDDAKSQRKTTDFLAKERLYAVNIETISFRALINANPVVATRDCQLFPIIYFSCFALRKVSVISTFVYRPWSSFLLVIFHMRILSVISASASRYLTVIVNFRKFIRFIVFSPV